MFDRIPGPSHWVVWIVLITQVVGLLLSGHLYKEWVEYFVDRVPLKRFGKPDDLDGAILFLASDSSKYVTV